MDTDNPDFVTLLPTTSPTLFLVAVMTYQSRDQEYVTHKLSPKALKRENAQALGAQWAKERGLEIR